jgi:hypothetical protein
MKPDNRNRAAAGWRTALFKILLDSTLWKPGLDRESKASGNRRIAC